MIARHDDEGRPILERAYVGEEAAQSRVRERHFARVGVVCVLGRERRRRLRRGVGIVDVHPREPPAALCRQPLQRRADDLVGATLAERELGGARHLVQPVVVNTETGVQAELRVERERADERAGREPLGAQARGERLGAGGHPEAAVVANAMLKGIQAGQDADVRGQRDDGMRMREVVADAIGGQGVEVRRRGAPPVGAKRVGPQRVDRDEQHVLIGRLQHAEARLAGTQAPARAGRQHDNAAQHPQGAQEAESQRAGGRDRW